MKNDDFWKSQFAKHDATPNTGKQPITPAPKAVSTTDEPSTSRMDKVPQPARLTQSTPGFEKPAPLVLSKFPAKTKTQWEQSLLNRKAVLVKK